MRKAAPAGLLGLAVSAASGPRAAQSRPPNFIVILTIPPASLGR